MGSNGAMHPRVPRMHRYDDDQVAEVCHRALQGLQEVHDDTAAGYHSADWPYMHPDLREAAVNGVMAARRGETPSAQQHHKAWCGFLMAEPRNWRPGPRDLAAKTHPNLVDWSELSENERDKTRLFLSTVVSLTIRDA